MPARNKFDGDGNCNSLIHKFTSQVLSQPSMSAVDVFESLFRRLKERSRKDRDRVEGDRPPTRRRPYLVLIQHTLGASTRQLAAAAGTADDDHVVYQRAGLRTPGENAMRDLEGVPLWIQHVTRKLSEEIDHVIWLQTTATQRYTAFIKDYPKIFVLNVSRDPLGWDRTETSDSKCEVNLLDLGSIVRSLEERLQSFAANDTELDNSNATCGLIVQSLSPILQIHDFLYTMRFLRRLQTIFPVMVVSIASDSLTDAQCASLQDLAQALLFLEQGEALLLRKGVREHDNVVRESIPFEIATDASGRRNIGLVTTEISSNDAVVPTIGEKVNARNDRKSTSRVGKPKIELHLEEERERRPEKPVTTTPSDPPNEAPRFYLEENDPEFDDYDEEDPDDDLNI